MTDYSLEDDLLKAVGHGDSPKRQANRQLIREFSSDSSPSDGNYQSEGEDEDDGEFESRKMNQRKADARGWGNENSVQETGTRSTDNPGDKPKRKIEQDGDDELDTLSIGSDLFYDSEDKEKLESLNEFERELELYKRSEIRDAFLVRKREREEERKRQVNSRAKNEVLPPSKDHPAGHQEKLKAQKKHRHVELLSLAQKRRGKQKESR